MREFVIAIHDLYWIPSAFAAVWGWRWLYGNWPRLKPIRGRGVVGILGLAVATAASLTLLAAVVTSWVVGRFNWSTPFDPFGLSLAAAAILISILGSGGLRMFAISSALLSLASWVGFVFARRGGIW